MFCIRLQFIRIFIKSDIPCCTMIHTAMIWAKRKIKNNKLPCLGMSRSLSSVSEFEELSILVNRVNNNNKIVFLLVEIPLKQVFRFFLLIFVHLRMLCGLLDPLLWTTFHKQLHFIMRTCMRANWSYVNKFWFCWGLRLKEAIISLIFWFWFCASTELFDEKSHPSHHLLSRCRMPPDLNLVLEFYNSLILYRNKIIIVKRNQRMVKKVWKTRYILRDIGRKRS